MKKQYPDDYVHLQGLISKLATELPGAMSGFSELDEEAAASGSLSKKVKKLIALGIAITVRCDDCIPYYIHDVLRAGANRREILETIGVAVLMGGGPSAVYGAKALEALDQIEEVGLPE